MKSRNLCGWPIFGLIIVCYTNSAALLAADRPPVVVTDEAKKVHAAGFIFDGHNDLPWALRSDFSSSFDQADLVNHVAKLQTDIPRLRQGNVGAQFWSVYVPAETGKDGTAFAKTIEQIELVRSMIKRYPETFEQARTVSDIERIRAAGKIASLIGVEGGHCIEDSIANLHRLHAMGAGYMTLTHSDTLSWVDAATDEAVHGGLTPFGEEIVREMNNLGMLVDLSHVSAETMRDAMRVSKAPVIFSHSSARAIADHPRNVPDDILRLVKENGGVVMINFYSGFVHPESARRRAGMFRVSRELHARFPKESDYKLARKKWEAENPIERGDVHDVVDHIDHVVKIAGIDHVGIGSDFDGIDLLPRQLDDVSTYPVITQELLNRGYTAAQIHQVMSGNILRVMRQAEKVAAPKP
ncbi:dipeptidase [Schlesneria paludicola]|uniref:dipeptidase n=1 Tax=Schlesneria paludicola TaxID=360056 RepID=UPI000299F040|nr:dipeptidase [Schlesneria paludicola]